MTTSSAFVREFLETLTHVYLHTRKLYPENTFVRRVAYGLQLRFCDYIDVAKYVEAVLDNACPLLDQDIVERFLFSVIDPESNRIKDQLSVSIRLLQSKPNGKEEILEMEEQLRSTILKVKCLDHSFTGCPDCTWNIMVVTRPLADTSCSSSNERIQETALQNALTSGQWYVENENLPENLSDECLVHTNEPAEMVPVKSFKIAPMQLETVAYKFG